MNPNLGPQWQVHPIEGFANRAFEARVGEQRIGEVFVGPSKHDGLVVNNIKVDPAHRRQGVAASLYRTASEANGGAPIDHLPGAMTPAAKKAVNRLAQSQPGMHRRVGRSANGNSRVGQW